MKPLSTRSCSAITLAIALTAIVAAYFSVSVSANFFSLTGSVPLLVTRTWDGGGATNNWSEGANWSGDTAPVSGDDVVFDGTSTKNATIDGNFDIRSLNINTGYVGTITQADTTTLTIGAFQFFTSSSQAAGTFVCGSGSTIVFGAVNFTQTGGSFNCQNGTINSNLFNVDLTAGTFNAPTGAMTLATSNFLRQAGAIFNHNGGTVIAAGNGVSFLIGGPEGSTLELGNLTLNTGGTVNAFSPNANRRLVVNGTLNLTDGDLSVDTEARGAVNIADTFGAATPGNTSTGSGKLMITGPSRTVTLPTLANPNLHYNRIELNSANSILTTSGAGPVKLSHLTLVAGTFNVSSTPVTIFGNLVTQTNSIFNCNSGTVLFSFANIGISTLTMDGGLFDCENGTFNSDSTVNITLNAGTFEAPSGTMTMTTTFEGVFVRQPGAIFNHNNGSVIFQGGPSQVGIFVGGPEGSTLEFGNLTLNTTGAISGISPSVNRRLIVNGTLNLVDGDLNIDMEARGAVNIANTFGGQTPGNTTTGSGKLIITGPPRTVTLPALTNPNLRYNPLELNSPDSVVNASGATELKLGLLTLAAGTFNVGSAPVKALQAITTQTGSIFNCNDGTVIFSTAGFGLSGLVMNGGLFDCENGTFDSEANIHITLNAGTFEAPSGTMKVAASTGSNFVRQPAATFNHNNGTLIFSGASAVSIELPEPAAIQDVFNLTVDLQNSDLVFAGSGGDSDRLRVLGHLNLHTGNLQNGTLEAHGNVTVGTGFVDGSLNAGRLAFGGSNNQTFTNEGGGNPRGTWTINKPSGIVTAASSMILRPTQQLLIQGGRLYLNENSNLTTGPISISAPGSLVSESSTTITLGGNLINAGRIDLNGSGSDCPGADTILIRSTTGDQRTWQGNGLFRLIDVDVQNMLSPGTRTVFSGTNSGGNSATWVFEDGCPVDLSITPSVAGVPAGEVQVFTGVDGSAPYTFSLLVNNSGAAIEQATGRYTAGATMGVSDTVRVTDAFGSTADATVNVVGLPVRLAFTVQPSDSAPSEIITPAVQVATQDANGNLVTTIRPHVTLSIGTNPGNGILVGTLTRQITNGIAVFDDLRIAPSGNGYTLQATNVGLQTATSSTFNIRNAAGIPTRLAFLVQPSDTTEGTFQFMRPFVEVGVVDDFGNTVPDIITTISLSPHPDNPVEFTLSGGEPRQTQNGSRSSVTFSLFTLFATGAGNRLVATSPDFASATSDNFTIHPPTTVFSTNDDGPGSLREAIAIATSLEAQDLVTFNIPGPAPYIINPNSLLSVDQNITVDATTQPGYTGSPLVEIRNPLPIQANVGLALNANATVKGLAITGFAEGIRVGGAGITIQRNHIGTNLAGNAASPNTTGINIMTGNDILIGGPNPGDGNVISGNLQNAIFAIGSGSNRLITGNLIGTDASGTTALPNGENGIRLLGPRGFVISGNVISANLHAGISIFQGNSLGSGGLPNNVIQNNIIGMDSSAVNVLGNGRQGVLVEQGEQNDIKQNRIFGNGTLGIQLGEGFNSHELPPLPNNPGDVINGGFGNVGQNYPVLDTAISESGTTTITGSLNTLSFNQQYRIDFYSSPSCDASGHGEGETFIGSTTVTPTNGIASIVAAFPVSVANARFITSTATDPRGNTSEFSNCTIVGGRYSISGEVRGFTSGIQNALVVATGSNGVVRQTLTDSGGRYSIGGLPNADYTVSVTLANHIFSPPTRTYPNLLADQTFQDFGGTIASSSLSGQVTTSSSGSGLTVSESRGTSALLPPVPAGGFPLFGVTFNLTGPVNGTITNDSFGNYRFDGLPNGTYTLTPSKPNYVFTPSVATVTIAGANQTTLFSAQSLGLSTLSGRIVNDSRGNIRAMNADGSGVVILARTSSRTFAHNSPRLSSDGAKIVYVSRSSTNSNSRIVTANADGSGSSIVHSSSTILLSPTFSRNRTRIAFNDSQGRLLIMNADGSSLEAATSRCNDPDWSPDGTKIVCFEPDSSATRVKIVDLVTRGESLLDTTAGTKFSPRWSPDGSKIAFIRRQAGTPATFSIVVKHLTGGTSSFMVGTNNLFDTLSWSPDGTRLLFTRDSIAPLASARPPGGNKQLVTIQASDGQNLLLIVDAFDGSKVDWSNSNTVATSGGIGPETTVQIGAVTITLPGASEPGTFTTVTPIEPHSAGTAPSGFVLGSQAFEISTTATFTPPATICVDLGISTGARSQLRGSLGPALFHSVNGTLVNITTSYDESTGVLCGQSDSFSPFVVAEAIDPALASISGLVLDENGDPLPGVSLDLTGAGTATTQTDSNGLFSFVNLANGSNYNVQPHLVGYLFTAYSKDFIAVSGESSVIFNGTASVFTISGRVVDGAANPVPGVVVDLTGNASDQVVTDADGNYLFTGLPADGAYFVTPSNQNFGFTPSDASIGALIADVGNVNFTQIAPTAASVSVSGRVLSAEGRGLSHVTVSIADPNGNVRSVHTNTFGYYRFDQVEVGMTYLIGVRSKRYQFENPDRAVSVQDELTDVDFIALPE